MESLSHSDLLTKFCSDIVSRHSDHWPLEESKLAEEFIAYCALKPFGGFENLQKQFESLGINASFAELPEQLYGFNGSFGGQRTILISKKQYYMTGEHTLLHELREILEQIFSELGYPTTKGTLPEETAETFAMCVRLFASGELWKDTITGAKEIKSTWKRRGAYALIVLGGLIFAAGIILPVLERIGPTHKERLRT